MIANARYWTDVITQWLIVIVFISTAVALIWSVRRKR